VCSESPWPGKVGNTFKAVDCPDCTNGKRGTWLSERAHPINIRGQCSGALTLNATIFIEDNPDVAAVRAIGEVETECEPCCGCGCSGDDCIKHKACATLDCSAPPCDKCDGTGEVTKVERYDWKRESE